MKSVPGLGEQLLLRRGEAVIQSRATRRKDLGQEDPSEHPCEQPPAAIGPAQPLGGAKPEELLPLVYGNLRRLAAGKVARQCPGQTLRATPLVHEDWLRLERDTGERWDNQHHFFGAAAEAMRRILFENARRKQAAGPGRGLRRTESAPDDLPNTGGAPDDEWVRVEGALDALAADDPCKAELVKPRYFADFTLEEAGASLGVSERTAKRDWAYARAWLFREIARRRSWIEPPWPG
jgi:RNA polymerase sigma factor (TIGR02999 family)